MSVLDEIKVTLNEVERKSHVIKPTSEWDDDVDEAETREKGAETAKSIICLFS